MKKFLALALSLSLVLAIGIAGTLAWLTSTPDPIKNTFTIGAVAIDLKETAGTAGTTGTDRTFKVSPGTDVTKDPTVTVKANSEASYVFVKIEKGGNFDTYFDSAMASGWTELTGVAGVFYRESAVSETDDSYSVLLNDKVTVKNTATAFGETAPTLTVTAYAIQKAGLETPAAAWTALGN